MDHLPSRRLIAGLVIAVALAAPVHAQTLARYAPPTAIAALELNDLAGARRTAGAFIAQWRSAGLEELAFRDLSPDDRDFLRRIEGFVDREGLVSVHATPASPTPQVLMVARPAQTAVARAEQLVRDTVAGTREAGGRVTSGRAGGFPMFVGGNPGAEPMAFGYQGGLLYASTDQHLLGAFLRRVGGSNEPGLAASAGYRESLGRAGPGTARLYLDLGATAGILRDLAGDGLEGFSPQPLVRALATLGRTGIAWRITPAGLETTTAVVPNRNGGDAVLYALLVPRAGRPLRAQTVVPATAIGFATGRTDAAGWYDYLNDLIDATSLNPGGLDPLLRQELGLDLRRVVLPWLEGEFASVTFAPPAGRPVDLENPLGETVLYASVTDEGQARAGVAALLPALIGAAGRLADTGGTDAPGAAGQLGGTAITRYPTGPSGHIVTAVRDGFLMVATSDTAMLAALAAGPRLAASAAYRAAAARFPAGAIGLSLNDTGRTLRTAVPAVQETLGLVLSFGLDLRPSDATRLSSGVERLLEFAAARAGTEVGSTVATPTGILTRSFLPIRW